MRVRYTKATSPTPAAVDPTLKFNFSGAVGAAIKAGSTSLSYSRPKLDLPSTTSPTGTGILAVQADGTTSSAITAGTLTLTPTRIYTAPDGAVVLQFEDAVDPATGRADDVRGCALLRIAPGSDHATCVDPSLVSVPRWVMTGGGALGPRNAKVQFDNAGNVYYLGLSIEVTKRDPLKDVPSQAVFRRAANGNVTDLVTVPAGYEGTNCISNLDFRVDGGGTVYVDAAFGSDLELRRITPAGSVTLAKARTQFLSVFGDGNLYFAGPGGISRYLIAEAKVEPWFSDDPGAACQQLAAGFTGEAAANCPAIRYPVGLATTAAGQTFGALTSQWSGPGDYWAKLDSGVLFRYQPEPAFFRTSVRNPAAIAAVGSDVVVAGTDASGNQRLIALDSATGKERVLLDGSNQIDIYRLVYSTKRGALLFDGLRFADNTYVIGSLNLTTGAIQLTPSTRLSDFQGF